MTFPVERICFIFSTRRAYSGCQWQAFGGASTGNARIGVLDLVALGRLLVLTQWASTAMVSVL